MEKDTTCARIMWWRSLKLRVSRGGYGDCGWEGWMPALFIPPRHRRAAVAGRGAGDSDARRVEHDADTAAHGLGRQVAQELGADGATAGAGGRASNRWRGRT